MPLAEEELYQLGPCLLTAGLDLPDLPLDQTAHILRGMWDHAGFIGPNNGGYPVVSLLAPSPPARSIASVIQEVTGKRTVAKPLGGRYWVGASGKACEPWLRFLYDGATVYVPRKLAQAQDLIAALQAVDSQGKADIPSTEC